MCVRGCRRLSVKWYIRCAKSAQEWVFLSPIIFLAPRTVLVGGAPAIEQGKPEGSAESYWGWNTYKHTGLSTTERYAVTLNYKNDRMVTYNDTVYGSNLATHLDNPYSIYVFCTNNHGTAAVCSKIKVYSVVITDGSDIIMHLVPVPAGLKIGDFTVPSNGMFDIVSQTFYGNSGSGEFEYGAEF